MPDEILRALLWLVETNKGKLTSPAVSSGEERGLIFRTAAGNRAYDLTSSPLLTTNNAICSHKNKQTTLAGYTTSNIPCSVSFDGEKFGVTVLLEYWVFL